MTSQKSAFEWAKEARSQLAGKHVLLFADFEGTFAPILDDPRSVRLPKRVLALLLEMKSLKNATIAVLSGRAIEDVRRQMGFDLIYAGNHGFEISGPDFHYRHVAAVAAKSTMAKIGQELRNLTAHIPGAIVEDKGYSIGMHYRMVADVQFHEVVRAVDAATAPFLPSIEVRTDKKMFEIRPQVNCDKGAAARLLRLRLGLESAFPVAIGDDATDEDLFVALTDGVTIKVNPRNHSCAKYRLTDSEEVFRFLQELMDILKESQSQGRSTDCSEKAIRH